MMECIGKVCSACKLVRHNTMTKLITTILLTLIFLTAFGQTNVATIKFKHTYYNLDGQISDVKEKTIQVDTILGLEFYKKNFYRPYYFPKQFIDKKFKNETSEKWNDSTKAKDFNSNWTYTYFYDSLSRVTNYNYSGCLICGQLPYRIQITYDNKNRPLTFEVRHSFDKKEPANELYVFAYDNEGNIIQINFFRFGKLDEQINRL
jgi:hypothetical protein